MFSVLSLSVARRAQQFALLGVLGLTGSERRQLVLWESLVLGVIGSAAGIALGFWLLCGLLGALMLYLWLGSAHWAGWRNHNLLLMNPLAWLLLPGAWAMLRGRLPSPRFRGMLAMVAGIALLALPLSWLSIDRQQNAMWIGLLLPLHLAFAWLWARSRGGARIAR